ncbi:MAG: MotA/TolQ/ExbB proton channel family protein [Candidatus Eremiobacteraeota bacterium]|nr:MotA/TolQ/ExbB proton channel family protein [Candidatus Eremiobacteraeota bacterium]
MDIATLIGLLLGMGAVLLSAFLDKIDPKIFLSAYTALILVVGGTFGATILSFPLQTFLRGFVQGFRTAFFEPHHHEKETIQTLVTFAEKARREGLLALETEAAALEDEFMRKGVQLVIDGRDADIIRKILETEVSFQQERGSKAETVFMTMGGFSPTLGIIGTVLGLIEMLGELGAAAASGNVAGQVGHATAVAFIATFFGVLLANLVWLPIAAKVKERNTAALLVREVEIEGILSIQAGDNPRLLEEKLNAYLPPEQRESEVEAGGGVAAPAAQRG